MADPCFMYGDFETIERQHISAQPEPVMTVLLIGYDGRRKVLTGIRDELWREFMRGDGGPACRGTQPAGWEYWCPQALLESSPRPTPAVQTLLNRGQK